ncbi:MAG: ATP-binding cassette domain-containing protein [Ignavibacteriaceae bacterium]|nr:ATP-binding cassette domain-containing protein [Ignavibacteriaceae bacterium]
MSNNANPVILTAKEIEVRYGEQIVLNKASLTIHEGDRIGLVGRNGTGKSTFLKIIAGKLFADTGEIAKRKDLSVSFLSQEFSLDETKTVYENIVSGAKNITDLINEYESLPFDSPLKHILEERISHADGWNLEKKIDMLIQNLNAPAKEKFITNLSGGEKRRIALCSVLVSEPDLLILDEPTNHLDTSFIEWLEDLLSNYKGTFIFVTHDRYFLDNIANRIVELAHGEFYSHQGNYTDYLINKSERRAIIEAEENKRQNFLRRELDWVMRGPKARRTKAKSRLDQYDEIAAKQAPEKEVDVDLIIPPADSLGNKVLELKSVSIKLGGKLLFENLNMLFEKGRKLGIVGNNGTGKTTLLKIILGELHPQKGKIEIGEKTIFNYVDQERLLLNDEDTVFEAISEGNDTIQFGKYKMNVWTYLRRFLFTDDRINTKVGRLSGGELSRLTLAKILMRGGNFLLLDEPTNDLDLPTLRVLEEALINFEGCVVVVSHDRYFLNRVCTGILALEGIGAPHFSEGNYDYYIEKRNARLKATVVEDKTKVKKEDPREKPKVRKLSWKETKELESIEAEIITSEKEVERIEGIFSSPDYYEKYAEDTVKLNDQLHQTKGKIKQLYNRWQELEEIKDMLD